MNKSDRNELKKLITTTDALRDRIRAMTIRMQCEYGEGLLSPGGSARQLMLNEIALTGTLQHLDIVESILQEVLTSGGTDGKL